MLIMFGFMVGGSMIWMCLLFGIVVESSGVFVFIVCCWGEYMVMV